MDQLKNRIPLKLLEAIEKSGLTSIKEILILSKCDIRKLANLNNDDISYLKNAAAELLFSTSANVITGHQLLVQGQPCVSTGCEVLDKVLNGGFRCGKITELYGESGSGKTQISLQSTINNWKNGVIYICTEELFQIKRFEQIKKNMPSFKKNIDYGENIFIEFVTEIDELVSCICYRMPRFLDTHKVSLIIIDSVAGPFRVQNSNYMQRAREMRKVAITLLKLAKKYNAAVLCTNQVTASFNPTEETVLPSLGLAWSNMISTRINLSRPSNIESYQNQLTNKNEMNTRVMTIVFSPDLPNTKTKFLITTTGVKGLI